ncbi:ABC transporter permease [Anatilimnocola sp. NA78]|uniref:ABC transporter permease n=1 Tax=Anatilimnocola sp. NA78 TaxID=3415683 RepID=UPI003CE523B3
MHTLKYIWRNVTRHWLRSALTILSIAFSLAFMTVLHGYKAMQDTWANSATENRVVVLNIQGFAGKLPIAHVEKIGRLNNVVAAVPYAWYGGRYQNKMAEFAQFGTNAEDVFKVWSEFSVDPEQHQAWINDPQGVMVDHDLAKRMKWEIGDKLPLQGTIYQFDLELRVSGYFKFHKGPTNTILYHWKYLDEGLRNMKARGDGNAGCIFVKTKTADDMPAVMESIDKAFANSDFPTMTQTEGAFAKMFADMMGNLQLFVLMIGCAVVLSLTLVAGNGMALSMRERTTEIAVLKAIGFRPKRILQLVLGEACLIAITGGILGIAMGCGLWQSLYNLNPALFPLPISQFAGPWMLVLLGVAVGVGFVSGIGPAIRAANLSVIDGLRRVI